MNRFITLIFLLHVLVVASGCSDSSDPVRGALVYYETHHSPNDPYLYSVDDWCKTIFDGDKYDSIVGYWELGELRVCLVRKNSQVDTYLLEKEKTATSTGFVPIILAKNGSQIVDPEPVMKMMNRGDGIAKKHIIYANKYSARQTFTHIKREYVGKEVKFKLIFIAPKHKGSGVDKSTLIDEIIRLK